MRKREILAALAVPAAVSAALAGLPAAAGAATGPAPSAAGHGPLTPALARQLAANPDTPVIVILKSQARQDGSSAGPAAAAAQKSLVGELQAVGATSVKRYSLVNSVAATVSSPEARRLAADPAVAQVVPDATFSIADPAPVAPAAAGRLIPARTAALKAHDIPGACAPAGKSQLAPEGLALTKTASDAAAAPTARKLGFTGAGVKVAYIADGIDPGNVNFKRANGSSAFTDVQDFTGNGPSAPAGGGEAFLDANTIAGQGLHVFNVNGFSAQRYPGSCDVRIQGVAPGASLVGLNVFSEDKSHQLETTTSMFVQAINYAVETARVNVLNESFGGNPLPDTTADVVKQFDDAAVKAGVTVSVSSGDAGTASTIGSPATDQNLISVGATTQFQAYAQSNQNGTRYFASKGWLSDNISAISSSGFDESGGTVNLVAPGDLSWASCTANPARFTDCANNLGEPSGIASAGGTSEAAPFVSGAAALVIQAFRAAHHGASPTPAQVKRILLSTADDLGTPAQDQGAGLLDSARAVQLAQSYGTAKRTGTTIVSSAGQLTSQTLPGAAKTWKVTVTNEAAKTQAVTISGRTLSPASTFSASGSVSLSKTASSQYAGAGGEQDNYATFKFRVPAGQGRLNVAIAYAAGVGVQAAPALTLFDPQGRVAGNSLPQGVGNFGNADVRAPAGGLWTAVVASPAADQGFTGKVSWQATTQKYRSFGSVSPSSLTLGPGKSGSFVLSVTAQAQPGDLAGSVLLHASGGAVTTVPVVVRSLIDTAAAGTFSGTLTGGNGRQSLGASDFYQFDVPAGEPAMRAEFALASNPGTGNPVGAYLVGPDGEVQGYGQNASSGGRAIGVTNKTLTATVVAPAGGRWTLVLAFARPTAGLAVSVPFTGSVAFTTAATLVPSAPLPQGTELTPGTPLTIPVTITNTSNAPQDYFLDPRQSTEATYQLAPFTIGGSNTAFTAATKKTPLPTPKDAKTALYFVPSDDFSFGYRQTSSVPAMTTMTTLIGGDPSVGDGLGLSRKSLCGTDVTGSYVAPGGVLASGAWSLDPTECGPFRGAAPAGVATDAVFASMAAFDPGVAVQTGDLERLAVDVTAGNSAVNKAVELRPGQSATVNVTFKVPAGTPAGTRHGVLYLDTLQGSVPPNGQFAGDQVTALPYSYVVPAG